MAADALAPCVPRPSAAMVLNMQSKQVVVFHEAKFQTPVPSPCYEIMKKTNTVLLVLK